jgi:carbamoyl-phosphate synthase large subunit
LEGDEYTCGLYGNGEGVTHSIIFKRKLSNATYGFTVSGEVVEDQAIENILKKVSYSLKLNGSCNIQLRMNKNDPIIFEINPRFSSTVMFRHKLGFRDVLWSCNSILGEVSDPYSPPRPGVRFYKGYTEYFDS